ncbi:nudC domain-containing protein 1 [Palaemon carinicauda]|uniref:nudC domain-containing protein 1 n=1 Tax=Palaemon carinicauda TaxID=392227 RepID=UPI0035B678CD
MEKQISLKPDFKLLNPDFDGYKLSSDVDVTFYSRAVDCAEGLEKRHNSSSFYLHTRLEALHNHLFGDPFDTSCVYYFSSKGHLLKNNFSKDTKLSVGEVVWQADLPELDKADEDDKTENLHYFASVCFPSPDLAVVGNGQGKVHILETGDRSTTRSWLESFECSTQPGILTQARLVEGEAHDRSIHCLMTSVMALQDLTNSDLYVLDEKLKTSSASAVHLVNWLTLEYNGATWDLSRTRTIAGEGTIEYCSVNETSTGVLLLCHKNFAFIHDSCKPIVKPPPKEESKPSPKFTFLQTSEDITMWVNIGTASKSDLKVEVTTNELNISIDDTSVISGTFSNPVKSDLSSWTINDGTLEITLFKATEGLNWVALFQSGIPVGEELLDPQLVEEVNKRLSHLTSDKFDANPDLDNPAYDPGQFEACDEANEDLLLLHLNGSSHKLSSMCHLGATQHLFNSQVEGNVVPTFCIRHDVDGVLWQPEGEDKFAHIATYNAFGYVKASKNMAKYTCAAPDNSYVAVADVKSHIYIFFQPEAFGGELRNRKSGKRINTVARQVVISMKTQDEILGVHTSCNVLFVLTEKNIYGYCLRNS